MLLATTFATFVLASAEGEKRGKSIEEEAMYSAANTWSKCAEIRAIPNIGAMSPTAVAEQSTNACKSERDEFRAKAYRYMLTVAWPSYAAEKSDALEFEFRYQITKSVAKGIEEAIRDAKEMMEK